MNRLYDGIYCQKLILKTDNFEGVISPLASFGTCKKTIRVYGKCRNIYGELTN